MLVCVRSSMLEGPSTASEGGWVVEGGGWTLDWRLVTYDYYLYICTMYHVYMNMSVYTTAMS